MKKLIYCAAALAAMIFAGSCQQENLEPVAQENTVTYTVELPGAQTKGFMGTVSKVDELVYEVWKINTEDTDVRDLKADVNGKAKATRLYQKRVDMVDQKTVITLNLVQDQEYTVLFWAQKAAKEGETPVYNTANLTDVHYNNVESLLSNQESYEAYYAAEFISDEDLKSRTVILKRPFAQLNLGTKNTQMENTGKKYGEGEYNVEVVSSKVTVSNVGTHFNVANNYVATPDREANIDVTEATRVTFETATDPSNIEGDPTSQFEYITVNGQQYEYVAMNYLFATGENVTVEYEINTVLSDKNGNNTTEAKVTNTVYEVPLQENYRTNIIGNLLTSETEYEVVIDPSFETPENAPEKIVVLTAEELQNVLDNAVVGDNAIYLGNDIVGDVMLHQKSGVDIVLYGQGHLYEGTIKIHNGSFYNDGTFKVQNVNFRTSTKSHNFIMPNDFGVENGVTRRYSNNVTVENCTFTAEGDAINTAVGVQAKSCTNLQVIGCTATDLHSLLQAQSCGGDVIVSGATINGKNGVAFKQVTNAVVYQATITAAAYGIRFDGNTDNYGVTIKDCNVEAVQPVIVRKMTGKNNKIAFEGTNTLVTDETFQVVITNGSDDEAYSYPTGTYKLTGNKGLNVYPIVNADAFAAAVANEKLPKIDVVADITSVGVGFEITRDVVLNMNNKVFDAGSDANSRDYALEIYGKNNVEVNGANFTRAGIYAGEGANVVFNSGIINHKPERSSRYIFYAAGEGTTITINDGTFNNDRPNNSYFWAAGGAIIYVEGGNFGGVASSKKVVTTDEGKVIISGGTFNFDPTEWLAPGYVATKNGSEWVVSPETLVTNATEFAEAIKAGNDGKVIILAAGATIEGTFTPGSKNLVIKSGNKDNKATVKGRVNIDGYADGILFENVKFEINDDSAAKNTFSGASYKYPAIVTISASATSFEGCEFETSIASGVCGINNGAHASGKMFTVNNCKFTGDFYAIRSRTLFSVTNSEFDIFTNQGTLAAVFTWGNGEAGTQGDSGANSVIFTGNTNINENGNKIYGVQLTSTTFNYCHINYNVQENDNFFALSEAVNSACDFTGKAFTEGSETF